VAEIDEQGQKIHYKLSYKDLEGEVTQGHIHFGQRHTVGGIVVWLCQTTRNPAPAAVAGLTPTCPGPHEGTVEGSIEPEQVLAQLAQGFVGDFDELVRAIRAGATYANVHSEIFTPGEIRGQIARRQDD
jgi:CHRD domain